MKKRYVLAIGLLCAMSSAVFGIDFKGPPAASLKAKKWSAGFIYSQTERDMKLTNYVGEGTGEIESKRSYLGIGYGVTDYWEVDVRLGVADADEKNVELPSDFAWGLGTKVTFSSTDNIDWGGLFQMNWIHTEDSGSYSFAKYGLAAATNAKMDFDIYEIQVAVGPTIKQPGWKIYGGPFFYFAGGDLRVTTGGTEYKFHVEEDSNFGGYIGASFDIGANTDLTVEVSGIREGWGLGTGITWKF